MVQVANISLHSNYKKFYDAISNKKNEIGFRTIQEFTYYTTAEEVKKALEGATNLVTSIQFIVDFEDGYILSKTKNGEISLYHPFEYMNVLMFDAINQNLLPAVMKEGMLQFDSLTPALTDKKFPEDIMTVYKELINVMNGLSTFQLNGYYLYNEDQVKVGEVVFNKTLFIYWYNDDLNVSYQNVTYDFNFSFEFSKLLIANCNCKKEEEIPDNAEKGEENGEENITEGGSIPVHQ